MLASSNTEVCGQEFRQKVREACFGALTTAGFARFRKDGVEWDLHNGIRCWVGLNTALHPTFVEINPFVGLHVVPLEKLWTGLKTGKYPAKYDRGVASIACHLGGLAPDERAFHFATSTDVAAEAHRLAALYVQAGLPYVEGIASYEALLPMLQDRVSTLGGYPERVACCLYLMDRKDAARDFVESFLANHRDYFEGFALPFIKKLDQERP